MSEDTVTLTYVGPCEEVVGRKGRTFVKGEGQELSREEALRFSGDFEIDGRPLEEVAAETLATDSALELADEHDVDVTSVKGTGAGGKVTKPDVQKVIDAGGSGATETSDDGGSA